MALLRFYERQQICYSAYMPRQFRPSVRPSVTRVYMYCIKTAERIIDIFYRAMHFSAYAWSWDRMSSVRPSVRLSVRPSVCNVGGL